ncbi:MAG: hypothetical protein PUP93_32505 [Rhizonema sp. NSF051]|nr:hypothetical protein [Rhizonema sp. NSF051]
MVLTRKRLNEFTKLHPDTTNALAQWYRLVKQSKFSSFVELCEMFPDLGSSREIDWCVRLPTLKPVWSNAFDFFNIPQISDKLTYNIMFGK